MKIGRHEYDLVKGDKFLDNGACVQLLTQGKETPSWGRSPTPTLSKRAVKELKDMDNIKKYPSTHYPNCFIYEVV